MTLFAKVRICRPATYLVLIVLTVAVIPGIHRYEYLRAIRLCDMMLTANRDRRGVARERVRTATGLLRQALISVGRRRLSSPDPQEMVTGLLTVTSISHCPLEGDVIRHTGPSYPMMVRLAALRGLSECASDDARPVLSACLRDTSDDIRLTAALGFSALEPRVPLDEVLSKCGSGRNGQLLAERAVQQYLRPEFISAWTRELDAADPCCRELAVAALNAICDRAQQTTTDLFFSTKVLQRLGSLARDPHARTRFRSLELLAKCAREPVVTDWARLMHDPDPRVRSAVARYLGRVGDLSAVPGLVAMAQGSVCSADGQDDWTLDFYFADLSSRFHLHTSEWYPSIRIPGSWRLMQSLVRSEDGDPDYPASAVESLVALKASSHLTATEVQVLKPHAIVADERLAGATVRLLAPRLADTGWLVALLRNRRLATSARVAAAEYFRPPFTAAEVDALKLALFDAHGDHPRVRLAALEQLAAAHETSALPMMRDALYDRNSFVRIAAINALVVMRDVSSVVMLEGMTTPDSNQLVADAAHKALRRLEPGADIRGLRRIGTDQQS